MTNKGYILAIDQGTSSTKCLVFDAAGQVVVKSTSALHTDHYSNGFVEQDPEGIYRNVIEAVSATLDAFIHKGFKFADITCCGISNQRETFLLWDAWGRAVTPAVVWACKRSTAICADLKELGQEQLIRERTGLILDPYFSGTKLLWLIRHNNELKKRLDNGEIFFGTVDCWLLYRLTGGKRHRTDHTNASRTLLFNIHTLSWDMEILKLWCLENLRLPEVYPSAFDYGESDFEGLFPHQLSITALIGDSHAAAFGEGCFDQGTGKVTMGTGSSILMNTGTLPIESKHGLLSTICWSKKGRVDYALEGAIVACGSTLEWLKNELNLYDDPRDTERMAQSVPDNAGVYLIPAFSGLGAPHWQMNRRASIEGMTFGTTKNHIVRAALESIPYQIKDVLEAIEQDMGSPVQDIAVNGGIANNGFVIRFLADLLQIKLKKRQNSDVSALGAAYMAGLQSGIYNGINELKEINSQQTTEVYPQSENSAILEWYAGWRKYVNIRSI